MEVKEGTAEKTFYEGQYLGSFAESLVARGLGTKKSKNATDTYEFSHLSIRNMKLEVTQNWIGLGNATNYIVSLSGSEPHVNEFMRAAEHELERLVNSRKRVGEQLEVGEEDGRD